MIPYFELTEFSIGPIAIQVWGLMVAIGILVGLKASVWLAQRRKQDGEVLWDAIFWILVGALVFARLFHVGLYEPGFYISQPMEILRVWHGGFSSVGGFLGATLAGVWFLRKRHVNVWKYADTAIFGLPIGLFIGRIGCFLIHDHPGTATDFMLGVEFPDGVVRHDLGLYLSLNALVLTLLFLWLAKRKVKPITYLIVFSMYYGTTRFFLDFLRATDGAIVDTRYLGLTPAQYVSLLFVGIGVLLWKKRETYGK